MTETVFEWMMKFPELENGHVRSIEKDPRMFEDGRRSGTFADLFAELEENYIQIPQKDMGIGFVPCCFLSLDEAPLYYLDDTGDVELLDGEPIVRRKSKNIESYHIMVGDYDSGFGFDEIRERFSEYRYILYSSASNMLDGSTQKARIILMFDRAMPIAEYRLKKDSMLALLGPTIVDKASVKAAQYFYAPAWVEDNADHRVMEYHEGELIVADWLEAKEVVEKDVGEFEDDDTEFTGDDRREFLHYLWMCSGASYDDAYPVAQSMLVLGYADSVTIELMAGRGEFASSGNGRPMRTEEQITQWIYADEDGERTLGSAVSCLIGFIRKFGDSTCSHFRTPGYTKRFDYPRELHDLRDRRRAAFIANHVGSDDLGRMEKNIERNLIIVDQLIEKLDDLGENPRNLARVNMLKTDIEKYLNLVEADSLRVSALKDDGNPSNTTNKDPQGGVIHE